METKYPLFLLSIGATLLHFSLSAGTWDSTEPEKFGKELDEPSKIEHYPEQKSAHHIWATFGPQSPELFEWLINDMKVDKKKLQKKVLSLAHDYFDSCPEDTLNRLFDLPKKK